MQGCSAVVLRCSGVKSAGGAEMQRFRGARKQSCRCRASQLQVQSCRGAVHRYRCRGAPGVQRAEVQIEVHRCRGADMERCGVQSWRSTRGANCRCAGAEVWSARGAGAELQMQNIMWCNKKCKGACAEVQRGGTRQTETEKKLGHFQSSLLCRVGGFL